MSSDMDLKRDVVNDEYYKPDNVKDIVKMDKVKEIVNMDDAKEERNKDGMIEEKLKVDLDTILINEVGQFGRFQLRTLALAAIAALFSACNSEYVFTTARINTRCLVSQCENTSNTEFNLSWLAHALPSSGDNFDSCSQFAYNMSNNMSSDDSCPANMFNPNMTVRCEDYVYENTHTVVYDFALACNEWRRSLIGFSRTAGTFLSLPLTGFVSDRWGRRTALALNAFNSAWIGLSRFWAKSYISFIAMEFLEAVFSAGVFSCSYILVLEIVGPKYRVIAGGFLTSCFALGQVCLGLIAWAIPYWRPFTLAIYIPQLVTFSYFWILAESVRWYLSKGHYDESEDLLKKIARTNRKILSEKSLQLLRVSSEDDKKKKALEEAEKALEPCLPIQVFRHKQILIRCLVLPVCWITTTMVYYGLSINSVSIIGNKYLNFVAVAAVEIPGFWLSVLLLSRIGRKPVLMGAFWMCAVCQATYVFMPNGNYGLSIAVYLIGKSSIATVVTAIYVYTTEVFPTKYRHNLFAFCSMMGRIGSITAPLTPAMGAATFAEMPFVLFGCCALLSGALIFLTPETLGSKLPNSMEEAEEIHNRRKPV